MDDTYYALFIDHASERAWIRRFGVGEAPQQGCHSGQSFGSDRSAAVQACRELAADGYSVAQCDLS